MQIKRDTLTPSLSPLFCFRHFLSLPLPLRPPTFQQGPPLPSRRARDSLPSSAMGLARGLYGWLGLPAETPFDPQARYVTSYLLPPLALASWRALVSLYTFVTLILVYVFNGASEFSFL